MADATVLSFGDSLLRKSDVSLLEKGCWLNDKIIGFAFEHFETEMFKDHEGSVIFITPDVSQFIKYADEAELGIFLEPLELRSKDLVFMAVNNNADVTTAGGSHWSLLVFDRNLGRLQHYDSFGASNAPAAKQMSRKLEPFLQAADQVKYIEMDSMQQNNGCDCGVFVISNAEIICQQRLNRCTSTSLQQVTPEYVQDKRQALKQLIQKLAAHEHR